MKNVVIVTAASLLVLCLASIAMWVSMENSADSDSENLTPPPSGEPINSPIASPTAIPESNTPSAASASKPPKHHPNPVPPNPDPKENQDQPVAHTTREKPKPSPAPKEVPGKIDFQFLSNWTFEVEDETGEIRQNPIPKVIRSAHGKQITIEGFIIPIEVKEGKVKAFLLSRVPIVCCWGDGPKTNEYIWVRIPEDSKGLKGIPYGPAKISGILEVGEERDEEGYILSLFRMKFEAFISGG
jgi:hypothetical protein